MQLIYLAIGLTTLLVGSTALPVDADVAPIIARDDQAKQVDQNAQVDQAKQVGQTAQVDQHDQSDLFINNPYMKYYPGPRRVQPYHPNGYIPDYRRPIYRAQDYQIGNVDGAFGANSRNPYLANAYWNDPNGPNAKFYAAGGVQRGKDAFGNNVVLNGYAKDVPCPDGKPGRCQVA